MASLTSLSVVSPPLRSSRRFLFKEGFQKKTGRNRISIQTLRVTYFNDMCCSFEGRFHPNYSCRGDLVVPLNMFAEMIPYHLIGSCCTRTTITGYWVGPDIDDGWGFVEALVDRST